MKHPRQGELALGPEAPPREMVVAGPDLARTLAELRAAGFEVVAMDVRRATYRLHLRRASPPPLPRKLLPPPPRSGYAKGRSAFVNHPKPDFPLSAFDL